MIDKQNNPLYNDSSIELKFLEKRIKLLAIEIAQELKRNIMMEITANPKVKNATVKIK